MDIEAMIKEMNSSISIGAFSHKDIEFLKTWFEVCESSLWDDGGNAENNFKHLLYLTAKYRNNNTGKKLLDAFMSMPQPDNKHITVSDLEQRNKNRLLKVWIDLVRTGVTPKGKELMNMIDDFLEHTDNYFPKVPKITANIDEIRHFMQSIKIDLFNQKQYLDHFILTK